MAGELLRDRRRIVEQNMRAAAASASLVAAFERSGVDLLFLKGLSLAKLVYRDPLLKMGWDIDILVSPDDIERAGECLRSLGYERILPVPRSHPNLARWHVRQKESTWRHVRDGSHVELHSRLADNERLIPGLGMHSPRQQVEVVPGLRLKTLARDELFAYLCVHGASSAWFRAKWLSDLAGLIAEADQDEVGALYRRSQELGAGRAAGQALLLIQHLFGLRLPEALQSRLRQSRAHRWLARLAYGQLLDEREPTHRPLGTAMIHIGQLPLKAESGFAWSEVRRQVRTAIGNA